MSCGGVCSCVSSSVSSIVVPDVDDDVCWVVCAVFRFLCGMFGRAESAGSSTMSVSWVSPSRIRFVRLLICHYTIVCASGFVRVHVEI